MRKIESKFDVERRRRHNIYLLGFVMIFLMVVSTIGYSWMDKDVEEASSASTVVENGITFYSINDYWRFQLGERVMEVSYLPSQVTDVDLNGSFYLEDYVDQPAYFSDLQLGSIEIIKNLQDYFLRYQEACVSNQTCEKDLPEKDCSENLFVFDEGEKNKVYKIKSCIYFEGDATKSADAFLYKLLGII